MQYNLEEVANRFTRDGYVIIEDFLTQDEIKILHNDVNNRIETYLSEKDIKNEPIRFFDGVDNTVANETYRFYLDSLYKMKLFHGVAITKVGDTTKLSTEERKNTYAFFGHGMHVISKPANKIITSDRVKNLYAALGYIDPVIYTCSIMLKNPRVGGAIQTHQDIDFIWTESGETIIGAWIPLTDTDLKNGCLEFWPGSHKLTKAEIENQMDEIESKYVPAEIKAGSLIIIHSHVVHRSGNNKSDRPRWAFTFHGYDAAKTRLADDCLIDRNKTLLLHINTRAVD